MKYGLCALAALFLLAAYLQLNDPDPLYWVVVYSSAAGVCLAQAFGRPHDFWSAATLGAIAAGMLQALPGFWDYLNSDSLSMIFEDMRVARHVESAREFLGLALVALALLWLRRSRS